MRSAIYFVLLSSDKALTAKEIADAINQQRLFHTTLSRRRVGSDSGLNPPTKDGVRSEVVCSLLVQERRRTHAPLVARVARHGAAVHAHDA